MKNTFKKRGLFVLIISLGIVVHLVLSIEKKQVDTATKEQVESHRYLLIFPNSENRVIEETSNEVIGLVISDFLKSNDEIFCDLKEDGTRFNPEDGEGYSDSSEYFDLDTDGVDELLVMPIEICGFVIRGASGNGPIYIFRESGGTWNEIGLLEGNLLRVTSTKSNGFYNLETNYHMSAYSGFDYFYEFQIDNETNGFGFYQKVAESEYNYSNNQ